MAMLWISLFKRTITPETPLMLAPGFHGVFVLSGAVGLAGGVTPGGEGVFAEGGEVTAGLPSECLEFVVSAEPASGAALSQSFQWRGGEGFLRLDQVTFPPGARAYRHTHPGPGIRALTAGALEIKSDHHVEEMAPGDAWFEDANSPVQATAGSIETAFVRAMVLPIGYLGKPTLNILDPADAALPRLQKNRRFFDQVLRLPG